MTQRGGARENAGRKPGQVTELKKQLSVLAREHAESALDALVKVAEAGESEAARVSASVALLDRAFGRPTQAVQRVDADDEPTPVMSNFELARHVAFILRRGLEEAAENSDNASESFSDLSGEPQSRVIQ